VIGNSDQVKIILHGIGKQTNQDLSFITSEHAVNYVRELENTRVNKGS